MRVLFLTVVSLLVAGCATAPPKEYPQTHYFDVAQHLDMGSEEPLANLPPPFNEAPDTGECNLILMVSHARGALPLEFDLAVANDSVSYRIWTSERIEEGVSVLFGEPSKELAARASRLCLIRIPAGNYEIVARINEDDEVEKREQISIKSRETQVWAVVFSPMGTLVQHLKTDELSATGE